MAIRIIDGVPGSGKTYYAVRHFYKKFFSLDGGGFPVLKKRCVLITNIDDFQLPHLDLTKLIREAGGVSKFFGIEHQEEFRKDKDPIVYIIDEAQRYFRRNDKTLTEVFSYFEYHRHWQQDIYLITQNIKKLHTDITYLVEYIIIAKPRIRSMFGELKYKWVSDGVKLKQESFKPEQEIFDLYKSMDGEEVEKIKNPLMKTIALTFGGAALVLGAFFWYFASTWGGLGEAQAKTGKEVRMQNVAIHKNGNGFVESGNIIKNPLEKVRYRLSDIVEFGNGKSRVLFIFGDQIYNSEDFPYPIKKVGSNYYAMLNQSEIPVKLEMENDG